MIRPLELFVGLRYVRARRRHQSISFISVVSIIGITLGIAALITVLSVMNGFGKELRARILGVVSHVTITGSNGSLGQWRQLADRVRANSHVIGVAPYILGEAMLANGSAASGALVRGVLPRQENEVSDIGSKMVEGTLSALKPGDFGVVVGSALAWKLNLDVGSRLSLVLPQAQASPAGVLPRFRRFTVVGIFHVDQYEYDSGLVLINLQDAAKLYEQAAGDVSGLRLKLDDLDQAPQVARQLSRNIGAGYVVRDWTRQHVNFFRALQTEKTVMSVLLLLIVAVAMFNLISTLVVIVTEKQSDIAILRTIGLRPRSIMSIFMVQGAIIGLIGTLVGTSFGVLLAYIVQFLQRIFSVRFLSPEVYLISELPSDLHWSDVGFIAGCSFVLALLSTLYPAWRASKVLPAVALRYE
jgi:lipoprotein-releasing system permease protein